MNTKPLVKVVIGLVAIGLVGIPTYAKNEVATRMISGSPPIVARELASGQEYPPDVLRTLRMKFSEEASKKLGRLVEEMYKKADELEGFVSCQLAKVRGRFYVELRNESYSVKQEQIYREFKDTRDAAVRERNAYILSELWKANLLSNEIKDRLVDDYYRLVLLQVYGNYQAPNFVVRCYQTFPFPSVWTRFTPTLYINGEVAWAPKDPQKGHAMSVNNSTITSRIGGVVKNGDVLQYEVKMSQEVDKQVVWEKTIWSNQVIAQGLKE